MENRYLVFGYYDYEAIGGWNDLLGSFSTLEDAMKEYNSQKNRMDTYEIVDLETMEIVWTNI